MLAIVLAVESIFKLQRDSLVFLIIILVSYVHVELLDLYRVFLCAAIWPSRHTAHAFNYNMPQWSHIIYHLQLLQQAVHISFIWISRVCDCVVSHTKVATVAMVCRRRYRLLSLDLLQKHIQLVFFDVASGARPRGLENVVDYVLVWLTVDCQK